LLAGLALLFFSGFSAFHHIRSSASSTAAVDPNEADWLPLDVLGMVAASVALILVGALSSVPEFRPTKGVKMLNAVKRDDFLDRPSFRRYHHRARDFRLRINQS